MQMTSKFTIAVHMITAIDYFKDSEKVTSNFLAGSAGANPVIVRNVMGNLKKSGIIELTAPAEVKTYSPHPRAR